MSRNTLLTLAFSIAAVAALVVGISNWPDRSPSGASNPVASRGELALAPAQGLEDPLADAGRDWTAAVGESVTLNASGSTDPEGQVLDFDWQFVSLPAGSLAPARRSDGDQAELSRWIWPATT